MKVTLDKEQLGHISKFIKAKGVSYSDVNSEMTDHIASEVEELMHVDKVVFLVAVKQVFLRYGRFHFMKIEEEQQKKLEKQSWIFLKNGFMAFFTFPKIVFTVFLFFGFYRLATLDLIEYLGYSYIFFVIVLGVFTFYYKRKLLGKGTYLNLIGFLQR